MNIPIHLIDVGAYGGLSEIWNIHHYLLGKLLFIDPQFPSGIQSACGGDLQILSTAIFDIEETKTFYQYRKKACNSFCKIIPHVESILGPGNYSRFDLINTCQLPCFRLDTILVTDSVSFDFLKVDAQGTDFNVVKSMGKYLSDLVGIQLELYHKTFYEKSILFIEANKWLRDQGFICCGRIRKNNNLFNDFIFLNSNSTKLDQLDIIKKIFGVTDESFANARSRS